MFYDERRFSCCAFQVVPGRRLDDIPKTCLEVNTDEENILFSNVWIVDGFAVCRRVLGGNGYGGL